MKLLSVLLLILCQLSSPLLAQALKKDPMAHEIKLSASEIKRFNEVFKEARIAHGNKDHQKAVQLFHAALAIDPNHVQALAELGYVLYFLKDYDLSESYSTKALQRSNIPNQKASILYNIALASEAKGNLPKAVEYCIASLKLRPNHIVRAKLDKLDPESAKAFNLLEVHALKGPYSNIKQFCTQLHRNQKANLDNCILLENANRSEDRVIGKTKFVPQKPSPYEGVYLLETPSADTEIMYGIDMAYYFVIKTKKGYFVNPNEISIYNPGAFGIFSSLKINRMEQDEFIKNTHPELKLDYQINAFDHDLAGAIVNSNQINGIIFCGIGSSEIPTCTSPMVYHVESEVQIDANLVKDLAISEKSQPKKSWEFIFEYLEDGINIKQGNLIRMKEIPKEFINHLGKRQINFP